MVVVIGGLFILIGGQIYIMWRLIENQERRIDKLLKYIKPDTHVKLKGIDEVKKAVQEMLDLEKKKVRDRKDIEREIKLLNTTGV